MIFQNQKATMKKRVPSRRKRKHLIYKRVPFRRKVMHLISKRKPISRKEAIKIVAYSALTISTMAILISNPNKAHAGPEASPAAPGRL